MYSSPPHLVKTAGDMERRYLGWGMASLTGRVFPKLMVHMVLICLSLNHTIIHICRPGVMKAGFPYCILRLEG